MKAVVVAGEEESSARAVLEILEPLLQEASFAPANVGPQERAQYFIRRFNELLATHDGFREENELMIVLAAENNNRFHRLCGQVREAREILRDAVPSLRSVEITDSDRGLIDDAMEATRLVRVSKNFFRGILGAMNGSWFSRNRRVWDILGMAGTHGLVASDVDHHPVLNE